MPDRINIKEIARKAGVSTGTVDRVLHNRGRVAEATIQKVLKIARDGNYQTNVYARNLSLNRVYKIAFLFPDDNPYWSMLKQGILNGVTENAFMGFSCEEIHLHEMNAEESERKFKEILLEEWDGIILAPSLLEKDGLEYSVLMQSKIPHVFVDSFLDDSVSLSNIGQDAQQSGIVGGRLLSNKYDKSFVVWVVTFNEDDFKNKTVNQRINGALKVFDELGLKVRLINLHKNNMSLGELGEMLNADKKPAHIFLPNSKSHLFLDDLSVRLESKQTRIIGYDLINENIKYLKSGQIDYLIDQQPTKQGYLAVQTLYRYLVLKLDVPHHQNMPINIISRDNIDFVEDYLVGVGK